MADKDSKIIKPVESLQNIAGLTPTRRREQRKRRRKLYNKKEQEAEQRLNDPIDEHILPEEPAENENDDNTIDYCA